MDETKTITRPFNIVFDLGGVLIRWRAQEVACAVFADPRARALVLSQIFSHALWRDFDAGRFTEAEAVPVFSRHTGFPQEEMRRLFAAYKRHLIPMPYTEPLLDALAVEGVDLFVLSNINADILHHVMESGAFWHRFQGIVASGEIGLSKPDPRIFEYLVSRYGLLAGDTVLVDDTAENVRAAEAAGMHGILFVSVEDCRERLGALLVTHRAKST